MVKCLGKIVKKNNPTKMYCKSIAETFTQPQVLCQQ
jgi:hypothetical protein